jgi:Helix-turn-helix of DDE superfamily endonuclease
LVRDSLRGCLKPTWARAALSHPVFTGLSQQHLGDLIAELADPWTAAHQGALYQRRGHPRQRAAGAGPHHQLVFTDRVLATLVVLRFQLPHETLAVLYGVHRATITRAIHEIRPLLRPTLRRRPARRSLSTAWWSPPATGRQQAALALRAAAPRPTAEPRVSQVIQRHFGAAYLLRALDPSFPYTVAS